jgi:hypothetical protein
LTIEQLIKYIEGDSTQDEKDAIAGWLDSDEKNWKEFMLLRKSYDLTLANLEDRLPEIPQIKPKKKGIAYELLKIAAIFIVAFGCYYLLEKATGHPDDEAVMHTSHVPAVVRPELTSADETNKTSLIKETVEISSPKTNESVKRSHNNRAYIENGKLVQAPIRYFNHFLWKDGRIGFENERLFYAFYETELNSCNMMKIKVLPEYVCYSRHRRGREYTSKYRE